MFHIKTPQIFAPWWGSSGIRFWWSTLQINWAGVFEHFCVKGSVWALVLGTKGKPSSFLGSYQGRKQDKYKNCTVNAKRKWPVTVEFRRGRKNNPLEGPDEGDRIRYVFWRAMALDRDRENSIPGRSNICLISVQYNFKYPLQWVIL